MKKVSLAGGGPDTFQENVVTGGALAFSSGVISVLDHFIRNKDKIIEECSFLSFLISGYVVID